MDTPKFRVGALVVWMMAIGAAAGAAQAPQARAITGTVVDDRGRGLAGAVIALIGSSSR